MKDVKKYWGNLPRLSEEFGKAVIERWNEHQQLIVDSGLADKVDRSVSQYYSRDEITGEDTTEVYEDGDEGEVLQARPNEYRGLIQAKLNSALAQDIHYQPAAMNDDATSLRATVSAQGILRHYEATGLFRSAREELAEVALVMAGSWVSPYWDRTAGELEVVVDADDEEDSADRPERESDTDGENEDGFVEDDDANDDDSEDDDDSDDEEELEEGEERQLAKYSGDVTLEVYNLFQVAYDRADPSDPDWLIVRPRINRFLLAKLITEFSDDILEAESDFDHPWEQSERYFETDDDYIYPFLVFFKPTVLTPYGREAIVLPNGKVIQSVPAENSRVPVFMLSPSKEIAGAKLPYGNEMDALLPCSLSQDAFSQLASQIEAHTPMLVMPENGEIGNYGNFKVLKIPEGSHEPKSIELFGNIERLMRAIPTYREAALRAAGVNLAMLGDQGQYSSGSKDAFQASTGMALQGIFTERLAHVMSQLATMVIEIIRRNMDEGRVITIIGQRGAGEVVRFKRSELELIQSVVVQTADPMLDTPAGRKQLADLAAERKWVNNVDEYVTAYRTGSLQLVTADNVDRTVLIRRENEQLMEVVRGIPEDVHAQCNQILMQANGQDVSQEIMELLEGHIDPMMLPQVCDSDDHREHYSGHAQLEYDDLVRKDPLAKHFLSAHNREHVLALTPGSPKFNYQAIMVSGQTPLPQAKPGDGTPNAPREQQPIGSQGTEAPQGSPPKEPGLQSIRRGAAVPGQSPKLPAPPKNAGSGQPAPSPALSSAPVPPGARA